MGTNRVIIITCFSLVLMLSLSVITVQTAEAKKGEGVPILETTSKRVCGNFICDTPMSMEEKIAVYLLSLLQQESPETNILQQAFLRPGILPGEMDMASSFKPGFEMPKQDLGTVTLTPKALPGKLTTGKLAADLIKKYDLKQDRLSIGVAKSLEIQKGVTIDKDKMMEFRIAQKEMEKLQLKPKLGLPLVKKGELTLERAEIDPMQRLQLGTEARPFILTDDECQAPSSTGPLEIDFEFLFALNPSAVTQGPLDVAVDANGNIYFISSTQQELVKVDPSGNVLWVANTEDITGITYTWLQSVALGNSKVYVADQSANKVHVYSTSGNYLESFGSLCNVSSDVGFCADPDGNGPLEIGDGQFYTPAGIAVDSSGRIAVAEINNNRVQVFDSSNNFLFKIGGSQCQMTGLPSPNCVDPDGNGPLETGDGQFKYPSGVTFDNTNKIYVADGGNGRVQVFDSNGNFLSKFGQYDGGSPSFQVDNEFRKPIDLVVGNSGKIYVVDSLERIKVFDSSGNIDFEIKKSGTSGGLSGSEPGEFDYPLGIGIDTSGKIYVADRDNDRIQIFDAAGNFVADEITGDSISEDAKLYGPSGVDVDESGKIYVADRNNQAVKVYSNSGDYITKFSPSHGTFYGDALAVSDSGKIYVGEAFHDHVVALSSTGEILETLGSACQTESGWGDCVDPDGNGPLILGDGQFASIYGLDVDQHGNLFVADRGNHRIQKFDSNGNFVTKFGRNGGTGYIGSGEGELASPLGVTISEDGKIFIADTNNNRVQILDTLGNFMLEIGKEGTGYASSADGEFDRPVAVDVDHCGVIYVADQNNHRIQVFNSQGDLMTIFGSEGVQYGQFKDPKDLEVDDSDRLLVADSENNRVQVFQIIYR